MVGAKLKGRYVWGLSDGGYSISETSIEFQDRLMAGGRLSRIADATPSGGIFKFKKK
jgi:hypothetical protein